MPCAGSSPPPLPLEETTSSPVDVPLLAHYSSNDEHLPPSHAEHDAASPQHSSTAPCELLEGDVGNRSIPNIGTILLAHLPHELCNKRPITIVLDNAPGRLPVVRTRSLHPVEVGPGPRDMKPPQHDATLKGKNLH